VTTPCRGTWRLDGLGRFALDTLHGAGANAQFACDFQDADASGETRDGGHAVSMSERPSAAYLGAGCLLLAGPVDALALSLPWTCFSPSGLVGCSSAAPPPAADGALASPVLLGAVVLFSVSLPVWLPGCCAIAIGATSSPAASNTACGIVVNVCSLSYPGRERAGFNPALRHHTTLSLDRDCLRCATGFWLKWRDKEGIASVVR
jgi:hypothetical protein